jgi:carbamoyltransferase
MKILGISAFYHDSAACLVADGEIVAAAQEERFTRRKHDPSFPANAIRWCVSAGGLRSPSELDCVAFYELPLLRFDRILRTFLEHAPRGWRSFWKVLPQWIDSKLWVEEHIREQLDFGKELLFTEHHLSHAASAFLPSPFRDAAILTLDGVGEWATGSWGSGAGSAIRLGHELRYPHSLGMLYSAFTHHLGFKVNSGEYKVMGLAPYGEPRHVDAILSELVDLRDDGSFALNLDYFDYPVGLQMTSPAFAELFGCPRRQPESALEDIHLDLARSIQEVTTRIVLRMARHVRRESGSPRLCLAGGVALNCVANGALAREGVFDDLFVQPAAGDAGGALGAALHAWHCHFGNPRSPDGRSDAMRGAHLGPEFHDDEIAAYLAEFRIPHERFASQAELLEKAARLLSEGAVLGFFHGRMEFGARALGARSILGDPRHPEMQRKLNLKIKFRESFRPFAPSVLAEEADAFFELDGRSSPYMLLVAGLRPEHRIPGGPDRELRGLEKLDAPRSTLPAITHVDHSARIQTVDGRWNPAFRRLLEAFWKRTGCPVLVNTSMNVRGEPICLSPDDAVKCFLRTDMDHLVLGSFLLDKRQQKKHHLETARLQPAGLD